MTVSSNPTVTVRVLLFAGYAEALGTASLTLTVPAPATVASLLQALRSRPGGELLPERPLCAVNLVQARLDSPVQPGDEIAVLPPLAGG
jgi:molybdopterin converting factor small subunit